MRKFQRSANKILAKSPTQKLTLSSASQSVDRLFKSIRKFHNPYVILNYCQQIKKWNILSTMEIQGPPNPSKEKVELMKQVRKATSDIYKLYNYHKDSKKQKTEILQYLKHKAKDFREQYVKYQQWQCAQILLNSQAVRKLDLRYMRQLIELFQQKKYQQIQTFFKSNKHIKEKQFQSYVKSKEILVQKVPVSFKNVEELIRRIQKTEPAQDIAAAILIKKQKYKQLEGLTIQILNPDPEKVVNGKVIEAKYQNATLFLRLKRTKDHINLQVKLDEKQKEISQVNVQFFDLVPIQNLIRIENRKFWNTIQSTFTKTTYLIKKECQIQLNSCQFPTVPIAPGFYDIFCSTEVKNDDQCYQLCFENCQEDKQYKIQVWMTSLVGQKQIVFEKKKFLYRQFIKSYQVRQSKREKFTNEDQTLEKSFKIQKFFNSSDNGYLYQKLNNIEQKKNNIIRSLKSKHFQDSSVFKQFINSGEIDQDGLKRIGIMNAIKDIIDDYSQIEQSTSKQQLIKQLIANFNYASFVPKYQTLKSISMINHFVNSQKAVQTMIEKDTIVLLGNTGSGKSTTADFLIGVPLKESKNCYGDKIIQIDQQQARKQNLVSSAIAKIGHSCVLSQTIYSRGHKISEKKGQRMKINKNVIICDNPGFQDTRGLFFQVCTRLSMDRAFQLCRSIQKVVLVLPEEIMKSQRSIHLINILITQIYERFQPISDDSSDDFDNFYIFITNARESYQNIQNLEAYFKGTLRQYKSQESQVNSKQGINEQKNLIDKITIFANLVKMIKEKRIIYLHVTSDMERIDILSQLGVILDQDSSQPRDNRNNELKSMRKKCLDDKYLRQFVNEVSISAHTFGEVILKEYVERMPAKIAQLKNEVFKIHKAIQIRKTQIEKIANNIKKKEQINESIEQDIKKSRLVITKIQNCQEIQKIIKQRIDDSQIEKKEIFQSAINAQKSQIDRKRSILYQIAQKRMVKENMLTDFLQKHKRIVIQVQKWKKSFVTEEVKKISHKLSQLVRLKNKAELFKAANKKERIRAYITLEKDYKLMPNPQFDPKGYISKNFPYGKYQTKVQSRFITLDSVKTKPDGKKCLTIIKHFNLTEKQQQLPYLKMTYQLPGQEHFKGEIRNKEAQMTKLFEMINQLKEEIDKLKNEEKQQSRLIQLSFSKIQQKQQQMEKIRAKIRIKKQNQLVKLKRDQKKKHQKYIRELQQDRKSNQSSISLYLTQIKDLESQIDELQNQFSCKCTKVMQNNYFKVAQNPEVKQQKQLLPAYSAKWANSRELSKRQTAQYPQQKVQKTCRCHNLQKKLKQKQWIHKRMAFLIRDQMNKKIPQTLKKFIDFTKILNLKNAEYKTQTFAQFVKVFDKEEATLLKRVEQHLKQP